MTTQSVSGSMLTSRALLCAAALALVSAVPQAAGAQASCPSAALPQLPALSATTVEALHSINSNVATNVCFVNLLSSDVNVFWIDFGPDGIQPGVPTFYNLLHAGQSYWQGTFVTHPWLIEDAGTNAPIVGFLPIPGDAEADIVGITATPEPSELALLATGLCFVVGLSQKRRRS
jgi:VHL beta domain